jgi:DNA-binding response OmpR family regulator
MADPALPLLLVIAHDEDLRDFYRSLFENDGWAVAAIPVPDPSLAWVRSYQPAALVLDVSSEVEAGAGVDYVRRLRDDHTTASVPVIICSAARDLAEQHRQQISALGATFLSAPFDLDDLLAALPMPFAGVQQDAPPAKNYEGPGTR